MNVLVIGGGPAGMMAAITASEHNHKVTLIEKNSVLGKKMSITGKGRCNITSSLDMSEFIKNIPGNGKFLYSAFQNYTNEDVINFVKSQGIDVKEERGNRFFPVTDKAQDVVNCFERRLKELNVKIKFNTSAESIITDENKAIGAILKCNGKTEKILADKIIISTGGKTYSVTGSTGDGYKLAKDIGHTITEIKPSLVPLECYEKDICQEMQGLSLKNIKISIEDKEKHKTIYEDFGEMIFTHFGVSGPTILSASSHLVRYKDLNCILHIDFKPALSKEKLDERILRDFEMFKNKRFKNSLDELLPQKSINTFIKLSKIDPEKQVNEITKGERQNLVNLLKDFCLEIKGFRPIDEGIVTCGGISIKEVNPKTMESKIIENLYFAGEVLDVDGYTGGFNLQIAYSTGYTAGLLGK